MTHCVENYVTKCSFFCYITIIFELNITQMRILFLLFFIIASFDSSAQALEGLKYDSIVKIPNSDLSLIYSKKKTAVWHDANFFVIQPTKNYFIFLEAAELLVEVDFKHKDFYAIVQNQELGGFKRFYIANNNFKADIYRDRETQEKTICFDGYRRNIQLDINDSTACEVSNSNTGKFGMKFENKNLIVVDKLNSDYTNGNEIVLTDSQGYDSIDFEGNAIYNQPELIFGVAKSGILNTKTKQWVIQPKYSEIQTFQNNVLVSTELNTKHEFMDSTSFYQMFKLTKNGSQLISKQNIINNDINVAKSMNNYDSLQQLDDKTHYITYKKGKQGLIKYQLFNTYFDAYSLTYSTKWPEFNIDILAEPIYDFVYYSTAQDMSVLKKGKLYTLTDYQGSDFDIVRDSIGLFDLQKRKNIINQYAIEYLYSRFGISPINDSLIKIHDIIYEENPVEIPALMSVEYLGEDSVDVNGDVVYYAPQPSNFKNGIYNLNQNKWVIKPNEYDIQYFGGKLLIQKPIFDEHHLIQNENNYSIYSANGKEIKRNLNSNDIFLNNKNIELLLTKNNEKLSIANTGSYSNHYLDDSLISDKYFYIFNSKEYKISALKYYLDFSELTNYHDFVLYDFDKSFLFYIDNDSSYFSLNDSISFNFTSHNYEINYIVNADYMLLSIDSNQTYNYYNLNGEQLFDFVPKKIKYDYRVNIIKNNNEIIINKQKPHARIYNDYMYELDVEYAIQKWDFETEESEIWRKIDGVWQKVTTNYAKIIKTEFGYICKTGFYKFNKILEVIGFPEKNIYDSKFIDSNFVIFDSTLKPIGYSDYYNFDVIEDLGFGYKICPVIDKTKWNTAEGYANCFFIDYNGKALCDIKFDNFELVDGKIYGIREEVYQIDSEFGEIEFDEKGNDIILQKYERVLIGEFKK